MQISWAPAALAIEGRRRDFAVAARVGSLGVGEHGELAQIAVADRPIPPIRSSLDFKPSSLSFALKAGTSRCAEMVHPMRDRCRATFDSSEETT
jgi:hypothetical protein